jgi:hypothetical protein
MRHTGYGKYTCTRCKPRKQKRKGKRGTNLYQRPKKSKRTGVSDPRPSYLSPLAKRNKNSFQTQGSSSSKNKTKRNKNSFQTQGSSSSKNKNRSFVSNTYIYTHIYIHTQT